MVPCVARHLQIRRADIVVHDFCEESEGSAMAQLVLRNIEAAVKSRPHRRAARRGRNMEEEVRDMLRDVVQDEENSAIGTGTAISFRFRKVRFKSEIPELRGCKIKPASFD